MLGVNPKTDNVTDDNVKCELVQLNLMEEDKEDAMVRQTMLRNNIAN
jgi:hypothetical protein